MENVLEEIKANSEMMEEISGTGTGKDLFFGGLLSWYLGNHGYVCTWTVECMKNCRSLLKF